MHTTKLRSAAIVMLFLTLPLSLPAAGQVPQSSRIDSRAPCDLEIHTPNVGVDYVGLAADEVHVQVRNPFADKECSIWRFLFIAQAGDGVVWELDPDPAEHENYIDGVPNRDKWVWEVSNSCSGPDALPAAGSVGPGTCNTLVVTAPQNSEMRPGGFVDFYLPVAFEPGTSPYCTQRFIGVVGVHLKESSSGMHTHSDMTADAGGASDGRNFTAISEPLDVDPFIYEEFSYMYDDDHNGHIDHVYVQFDRTLDPATVEVGDWNIGQKTDSSDEYPVLKAQVVSAVVAPQNDEYCVKDSGLIIKFDEEDLYDTGGDEEGIMPEVSYRQRPNARALDARLHEILSSLGGVRVPTIAGVEPFDAADPVLVSAIIQLDEVDPEFNTRVLVTFSEPVLHFDSNCEGGGGGLSAGDLEIAWRSEPGDVFMADAVARVQPAHEVGDRRLWLEFDGLDSDPAQRIEEPDLEYRFEQLQSHNVIEPNAKPHRVRPAVTVCDEDGNVAWDFGCDLASGPACIDEWKPFSLPHIVSVDGNIGFNKVTVRFSSGVNISTEFLNDPNRLFTIIEGRGPSGVTSMEFTAGADKAILTLDASLKPEDVTGDETFLRILGGEIWAAYTERHNGTADGTPWFLPTQDQPIVDVTPPSIMFALTRDLDSNGRVDAYELRISEPVVDLRFREGSIGDPGVIVRVDGHDVYRRIDVGRSNDGNLTIGFQPSTDLGGYATHRLPQLTAVRQQNDTGLGPGLVTDQAVDPNFPDLVIGNWMDNVTEADLVELDGAPPVVMDAHTIDRDENGLIDGFVVIFSEPVNDTSFDAGHWTVVHPQDQHVYAVKGLVPINAVEVLNEWDYFRNDEVLVLDLEERVRDPQRPFPILEAMGDTGIPVPDIRYFAPLGEGLQDLANLPTYVGPIFLGGPNRMLNFGTTKVIERDEARPVLVRGLGCEGHEFMRLFFSEGVGVIDAPGQPMRAVQEQDLFYSNGNGPNVNGEPAASGFKTDTVVHQVGEPFLYVDLDAPLHSDDFAKDRIKVVPSPDPPQDDLLQSVVREVGGSLHTGNESADFGAAADVWPPEAVGDARVAIDANGGEMVGAGTVTLEWTIPADQGCLDAGVVAYDIRAQDMDTNGTPISASNFNSIQNPPVFQVEYSWYDPVREMYRNSTSPGELLKNYTVGEGLRLQARIIGLTPDTNYQIAMKAVDNATNKSPVGNVVTIKTLRDPSPPLKPAGWELRSMTHPRGQDVKADVTPVFDWEAALDNETIFPFYIYAVTPDAEHTPNVQSAGKKRIAPCLPECNLTLDARAVAEVAPSRPSGLAPMNWYEDAAVWYLHLSACSGGGCTLLDSYEFRVDSLVNRNEMLAVNAEIDYRVVFDEASGTTRITWEMPDSSILPDDCIENRPGAQKRFEGVQVWSRGTGEYELLGTFGSDSNAFRQSSFTDTSQNASAERSYLVTGYCPDQAVTYFDPQTNTFKGDLLAGPGLFPATASPRTDEYPGTQASLDEAPPNLLWLWILLGVLALLVIVGLVAYLTMRNRQGEERWEEGELEEQDTSGFGDEGGAEAGPPGEAPEAGDAPPDDAPPDDSW